MADTLLVYADTSVYGGVFDREFASPSRRFFEAVQTGTFELLVSDVVRREIESAPQQVQDHFTNHLGFMRRIAFDEPVLKLRDAYLASRILEPKWADDAGHVAAATIGGADLIVSWNFKHIVHFGKIRLYNAVNQRMGHGAIDIRSPLEVIE